MNPEIIISVIVIVTVIYFASKPLIELFRDRKNQKSLLNPDDLQTEDIRIWAQTYRQVIISYGENFDYIKFRFTDNEVFVYMRNSFPGIYNGPILIKEKLPQSYSYLGKLDLIKFSINGSDANISFGHKNFIGVKYNFHLTNITDRDIELLKLNLC